MSIDKNRQNVFEFVKFLFKRHTFFPRTHKKLKEILHSDYNADAEAHMFRATNGLYDLIYEDGREDMYTELIYQFLIELEYSYTTLTLNIAGLRAINKDAITRHKSIAALLISDRCALSSVENLNEYDESITESGVRPKDVEDAIITLSEELINFVIAIVRIASGR